MNNQYTATAELVSQPVAAASEIATSEASRPVKDRISRPAADDVIRCTEPLKAAGGEKQGQFAQMVLNQVKNITMEQR